MRRMQNPIVGRAIAQMTENHRLDPNTDHCKTQGPCKLKSGLEVTFVSLAAQYLFEKLQQQERTALEYHQCVYMPSRRAERKVGYDLSIGKYDQPKWVHSMHKLLLSWCDNRRSWTLNPRKIDHVHLKKLHRDYSYSPNTIRSYLVLHLCYCIHDYRRMGMRTQLDSYEITLPGVESLLRTVVVPLDQLFSQINNTSELTNLSVQYYRNSFRYNADEPPQTYLDRIADRQNHHVVVKVNGERTMDLRISTLEEWCDEAVEFLIVM